MDSSTLQNVTGLRPLALKAAVTRILNCAEEENVPEAMMQLAFLKPPIVPKAMAMVNMQPQKHPRRHDWLTLRTVKRHRWLQSAQKYQRPPRW